MSDQPLKPDSLEQFARLLAVGVEAGEAYRKSGVGGTLACTVREAERRPEIVARVAALKASSAAEVEVAREPSLDPRRVSKTDVIGMLLRDRELARSTGQASAAVRAGELIGKEIGMFVDRKQIDLTVLDKMDIDEQKALLSAIEELERGAATKPTVN